VSHYNTFEKAVTLQKKAKKNIKNRVKWAFAGNPGRRPFCAKDQRKSKKFRKNNRKRRKITKI
jgi:hypothetical protein